MARENDIVTALTTLQWVGAIFLDGLWEDNSARGNRNIASCPYIELQASQDYGEHDSDSRLRKASMDGRIVYLRGQSNPNAMRNDLEAILLSKTMNLANWNIGLPARFSTRLDSLPFSITYWESAEKTA